jgi:hypothetical protein
MKLIICIFEKLPRLKVNFHESEIYCFGLKKDHYRNFFGCETGAPPFKYLGIPIHSSKLKNGEWKPLENHLSKN